VLIYSTYIKVKPQTVRVKRKPWLPLPAIFLTVMPSLEITMCNMGRGLCPHKLQHRGWVGYTGRSRGIPTLVAETKGSTPLISKPNIQHIPEPIPSTSHPHNLFP